MSTACRDTNRKTAMPPTDGYILMVKLSFSIQLTLCFSSARPVTRVQYTQCCSTLLAQ